MSTTEELTSLNKMKTAKTVDMVDMLMPMDTSSKGSSRTARDSVTLKIHAQRMEHTWAKQRMGRTTEEALFTSMKITSH